MSTKYKLTKQRKVILDELKKLESHPTAEELFDIVKKLQPTIGLCTVYRNLDKFIELGMVREVAGKLRRFDCDARPHHHIRCTTCGKVQNFPENIPVSEEVVNQLGFSLEGASLDICTTCTECRAKQSAQGVNTVDAINREII